MGCEAVSFCEETVRLHEMSPVWPLDSSEVETLAFHPSKVCLCCTSSEPMHQLVFLLTDLSSISCLQSQFIARQLGGSWRDSAQFMQLIFLPRDHASQCSGGIFFKLMRSRIVKSSQVRSDLCNGRSTSIKHIYAEEGTVNLVTIISYSV